MTWFLELRSREASSLISWKAVLFWPKYCAPHFAHKIQPVILAVHDLLSFICLPSWNSCKCSVFAHDHVVSHCPLVVCSVGRPTLTLQTGNVVFNTSDSLSIKCTAIGFGEPNVSWVLSQPFNTSQTVSRSIADLEVRVVSMLKIDSLTASYNGNVSCQARNEAGLSSISTTIIVQGKTSNHAIQVLATQLPVRSLNPLFSRF